MTQHRMRLRELSPSSQSLAREVETARSELRNIRTQLRRVNHVYERDLHEVKDAISRHRCHQCGEVKAASSVDNHVMTDGLRYNLKPIGYIESLFKYKNGTPRQPVVSSVSKARLTIDKTVFNNPEHSLEGLEEFSHVWIIFVFHKNNNEFTKAKVKPPRLDGKKVGLYSTRCPYRPNPIGLTLAKIEQITGSTIHLSGVDMIDGTPVLDIKPYIPAYDKPTTFQIPDTAETRENAESHLENNNQSTVPLLADQAQQGLKQYYTNTKRAVARETGVLTGSATRTRSASPYDRRNFTSYLQKRQEELRNMHAESSSSDSLCNDKIEEVSESKSTRRPSRKVDDAVKSKSLMLYFYDEKAREKEGKVTGASGKLRRSKTDSAVDKGNKKEVRDKRHSGGYETSDTGGCAAMSDSVMSSSVTSSEMEADSMTSSVSSIHDISDFTLQRMSSQSESSDVEEAALTGNKYSKPLSQNTISGQAAKAILNRSSFGDVVRSETPTRTRSASPYERRSYHGGLATESSLIRASAQGDKAEASHREYTMADTSKADKPYVTTASWISKPPIATGLDVKFTTEAESQLEKFSSQANEAGFMLTYLTGAEDARIAIVDILTEDPRSAYRRRKCQDSLYYFTVDNIHVTCWFDDETRSVEVVKLKPVLNVEQLKRKK